MSISHFLNRIKSKVDPPPQSGDIVDIDDTGRITNHSTLDKVFLTAVVVLISLLSFGVGRLTAVGERAGTQIYYEDLNIDQDSVKTPQASQGAAAIQAVGVGEVVVSKNGSKYHYSHCSGAKQIAEKNRVVFQSATDAEQAGYTLAQNCKPR